MDTTYWVVVARFRFFVGEGSHETDCQAQSDVSIPIGSKGETTSSTDLTTSPPLSRPHIFHNHTTLRYFSLTPAQPIPLDDYPISDVSISSGSMTIQSTIARTAAPSVCVPRFTNRSPCTKPPLAKVGASQFRRCQTAGLRMFGCIIRPGSSFGNTGPKMHLFLEHVKQWVDGFGIERIGGPFISKFNITWAAVLQIYLGTVGVAPTQRMKVCVGTTSREGRGGMLERLSSGVLLQLLTLP